MKQHITKEQWDELTFIQKAHFLGIPKNEPKWEERWSEEDLEKSMRTRHYPSVGQMIEFLGINLFEITHLPEGWEVRIVIDGNVPDVGECSKSICDALWEAVKAKLKH